MKRIGGPPHLPGAEIVLPALLVKVSEHQEEQQGHEARDDNHVDADTIHDTQKALVAVNVFTPGQAKQ